MTEYDKREFFFVEYKKWHRQRSLFVREATISDRLYFHEAVTEAQASIIYAEEADVLNVAIFGQTAKQWRDKHPELKGNIRDNASINELICLANMENINAILIDEGVSQSERLIRLNKIAIHQMQVLENDNNRKLLK